jgi:hypothetical protein
MGFVLSVVDSSPYSPIPLTQILPMCVFRITDSTHFSKLINASKLSRRLNFKREQFLSDYRSTNATRSKTKRDVAMPVIANDCEC